MEGSNQDSEETYATESPGCLRDSRLIYPIFMRRRLNAVYSKKNADDLQRLIEDLSYLEGLDRKLVGRIDGLYREIANGEYEVEDDILNSVDVAECFIISLTSYVPTLSGINLLLNIILLSSCTNLTTNAESRLYEIIFDEKAEISFDKLGYPKTLATVLLSSTRIFRTSCITECETRLNIGTTICRTILSQDDCFNLSKSDKNDIYSFICNHRLDSRHLRELLNREQWETVRNDLFHFIGFNPSSLTSKFVENLMKICRYLEEKSDFSSECDYIKLITGVFFDARFQIHLLLSFIEDHSSDFVINIADSDHHTEFIKLTTAKKGDIEHVLWISDTDILLVTLSLLYNESLWSRFKDSMFRVIKNDEESGKGCLAAKAVIYKLCTIWLEDQNAIINRNGAIRFRMATMNPMFWFLFESCLEQFITREALVNEIKHLNGESLNGKASEHLYSFISAIVLNMPGECILLTMLELIRFVRYDADVLSFTFNMYQTELLKTLKITVIKFSVGILEIVCFCRQNFDWGFMTMLIYTVDRLIETDPNVSSRNISAKNVLANGFMEYLRWKLQQIKHANSQGCDLGINVFIPRCDIIAEIFCILNHIIGANDELLDLFFLYNEEYKTLNYYNVLLLPLFRGLEEKSESLESCPLDFTSKDQINVANHTSEENHVTLDLSDRIKGSIGKNRDVYGYLLLNEDIESTTSQVVSLIFAGKMHNGILNAVHLLNSDGEAMRSQLILDLLLRKLANRLNHILTLELPKDFCLHFCNSSCDDNYKLVSVLCKTATFCGDLISLRLSKTHYDSLYIIFYIILEALRRDEIYLVEFAILAFCSIKNIFSYPMFTRTFIAEKKFEQLYPAFVSDVRRTLDSIGDSVFELDDGTVDLAAQNITLGEVYCLKGTLEKGELKEKSTGLKILKQPTASQPEKKMSSGSISGTPKSASTFFSIVNLAANVKYSPLSSDSPWYNDQLSISSINLSLEHMLKMLKLEFSIPPNALEIMGCMDVSFTNKSFVNHVEQLVTNGYVDWLLFVVYRYIIVKGDANFRDCIVFMTTLGGNRMMDAMVKFAAYSLNVFLKYLKSCVNCMVYRKLLRVSASWLGAITIGRNKPLLAKHLDVKHLLLYSLDNGLLTITLLPVCKLLENVKNSKIFKLPNPWTHSLLSLLADISNVEGLKSTLKFDIGMLFRHLEFSPAQCTSKNALKHIKIAEADQSPKVSAGALPPDQIMAVSGRTQAEPKVMVTPIHQEIRNLLRRKIVSNPKIPNLQLQLPLSDIILNCIEACYKESVPIAEKAVITCIKACGEIIKKDFAPDSPPELVKKCATSMLTGLASSLVLVNSHSQLLSSFASRLQEQLAAAAPINKSNGEPIFTSNEIEQISQLLANDNLSLVCALLEQLTVELTSRSLDDVLAVWHKNENVELNPLYEKFKWHHSSGNTSRLNVYKRFTYLVSSTLSKIQNDGGFSARPSERRAGIGGVGSVRLPDFLAIPPIDNLPTSLILCKFDEFECRLKEAAKYLLMYPPTVPFVNSKFLYTAETPTLLLLTCLQSNHVIFNLLWTMHHLCLNAANPEECHEAIAEKILKSLQEPNKCVDVVSITMEVELCLLEMLCLDSPGVLTLTSSFLPSLSPYKLSLFARFKLLKLPSLDRFLATKMDCEHLSRTLYRLVVEGGYVSANDLPQCLQRLTSFDPSTPVQVNMMCQDSSVELGEVCKSILHSNNDSVDRVRSLRLFVTEKGHVRNRMVIKLQEPPNKQKYIKMFADFMNEEIDTSMFYVSFIEHPPDVFLVCTLMCALQMSFEPLGSEMKCDRLPQSTEMVPVYSYCDAWSKMVAGLARSDMFVLQKALHLMLGIMQHGICFPLFERIAENLMAELESNPAFVSMGHFLLNCAPSEMAEFCRHWLNLIMKKNFIQHMISSPTDWPLYHQLLVEALSSPHSKAPMITFIFVLLMQRVPEFLCGYYLSLCDALPQKSMQLRNLLACAAPRSLKLPNPMAFDEVVEMPPLNFTNHVKTVVMHAQLKCATDAYVMDPNDSIIPLIQKELQITGVSGFDHVLLNHYLLYLGVTLPGILHKIPSSRGISSNCHLLLEKLVISSSARVRHLLVSSMTNHLRYPNQTTFKFTGLIFKLFERGDRGLQEQVVLSLLERLVVSKPYPWGVLHLFFQIVKNPKYDFWSRLENSPELEKHIRNIMQGCLTTKQPPK